MKFSLAFTQTLISKLNNIAIKLKRIQCLEKETSTSLESVKVDSSPETWSRTVILENTKFTTIFLSDHHKWEFRNSQTAISEKNNVTLSTLSSITSLTGLSFKTMSQLVHTGEALIPMILSISSRSTLTTLLKSTMKSNTRSPSSTRRDSLNSTEFASPSLEEIRFYIQKTQVTLAPSKSETQKLERWQPWKTKKFTQKTESVWKLLTNKVSYSWEKFMVLFTPTGTKNLSFTRFFHSFSRRTCIWNNPQTRSLESSEAFEHSKI